MTTHKLHIKRVVIVGTGGHAREIHELIEDINTAAPTWEIMGWLDSNAAAHGTTVHDLPVLGDVEWLQANPDVYVTVAIGAPPVRRRVVERVRAVGHTKFATLIHPTALIGRRVEIGEGTVICAGVITSTDYRLGQHVLINRMATVAHDDHLHDFVTIAPQRRDQRERHHRRGHRPGHERHREPGGRYRSLDHRRFRLRRYEIPPCQLHRRWRPGPPHQGTSGRLAPLNTSRPMCPG